VLFNINIYIKINGIKFIDKTQFERGKIIMFRFEVWIDKSISENELKELTEYLKKEFGCGEILTKRFS
jgi:hypothetical protein